jgi:hypothetical protein
MEKTSQGNRRISLHNSKNKHITNVTQHTLTPGQGPGAVLLSSPNQTQVHGPKQKVADVDNPQVQARVKTARSGMDMGLVNGGGGSHRARTVKRSINEPVNVSLHNTVHRGKWRVNVALFPK